MWGLLAPPALGQDGGVRVVVVLVVATAAVMVVPSCSSPEQQPGRPERVAPVETLLDSAYCGGCHREQYAEWAGSMHAYAADDPVFRALNDLMQKEVPPEQRTFCLNCHAPMAVRLGKSDDVAALDATPNLKGVTCFFCHTMESVGGTHNNPLVLGEDHVMGGAIRDPVDPEVHKAEYRTWLDGTQDNQSGMCGACHDIVTVAGAHIERTFNEWRSSRFGVGDQTNTSCASCHMPARTAPATVLAGSPVRTVHDHSMVGVDVALTAFPGKDDQRAKVQRMLDDAIDARLCVDPSGSGAVIDVALINRRVGHAWPSGANQDRRAWIEITALAGGSVIFESGHVPDDVAVARFSDPNLFVLRDHDFDTAGNETERFWRAARFTTNQLPAAVTSNPANPKFDNSVHVAYVVATPPDRVFMAVKIRPIDHDLIELASQSRIVDLRGIDPTSTFTLAKTRIEWNAADARRCSPSD